MQPYLASAKRSSSSGLSANFNKLKALALELGVCTVSGVLNFASIKTVTVQMVCS